MLSKSFQAYIENVGGHMHVVRVPEIIFNEFWDAGHRRILAQYGNRKAVHIALNPRKKEDAFLYLSKSVMKELGLFQGEDVEVTISEDRSTYQAPEPEEWMELMHQDEEIEHRFKDLTMGQKRSILFMVDKPKSSDAKLRKALRIAENLRMGKTNPMELGRK